MRFCVRALSYLNRFVRSLNWKGYANQKRNQTAPLFSLLIKFNLSIWFSKSSAVVCNSFAVSECTLFLINNCNKLHTVICILFVEMKLTHCAILFQHFKHRKRKNKLSFADEHHTHCRAIHICINTHAFRSSIYPPGFYRCPFLCTRRKSLSAGPSYNSYQIC